MNDSVTVSGDFEFYPLTRERWGDFVTLFGKTGACGGCWCMWWRLKRAEFERIKGDGTKKAMKDIVDSGSVPGLLVYHEKQVMGWCSVAPREDFPVLQRSHVLKPVDDKKVFSLVCFFLTRQYRAQGLSALFIEAAIKYSKNRGATLLEAYPIIPKTGNVPVIYAFTGFYSTFVKAGFTEVARRSEKRPIMRYTIE